MIHAHQQAWRESEPFSLSQDAIDTTLEVIPTDRVGTPISVKRRPRLGKLLVIALLAAGAYEFVRDPDETSRVVAEATSLVQASLVQVRDVLAQHASQSSPAPAADMPAENPVPPLPPLASTGPTEQTAGTAPPGTPSSMEGAHASAAASADPSTEAMGTAYSASPAPAETGPDKAATKRAVAVGLSPDLPNVLLTRLTQTDIRNAGYAIKTALAKTADDGTFTWPKSPSQQQALFQVRFVPGAPHGCRRYVVTVTKDRWSSTSGAVEKCNDEPARVAPDPSP